MKKFTKRVVEENRGGYQRRPMATDLKRFPRIIATLSFPGMVTSIDFQHYEWKSCHTSLAGAHKGKIRKPRLVLEGIADG